MAHVLQQEERDSRFMKRALEIAGRVLGKTSPNPAVGAVVVRGNRIVGEGATRPVGGKHAEIVALGQAGDLARGATLYVTLEPCSIVGRTPACAAAVVDAGIVRVVVGTIDPNPRVRGRGLRHLRRFGLEVALGVERAACTRQIRYFAKHITTGEPFVTLKLASSLDGKIATVTGASRWITGTPARRLVHRWRSEMDAILVGIGTVLTDDPVLTARGRGGRDPVRVVLDSQLRTPPKAAILSAGSSEVLIATTRTASAAREKRLVNAGATVIRVGSRHGRVDPRSVFRMLGKRGIVSVLVEGGSAVASSLLRAGLIDDLALFQAPAFIGGDGKNLLSELGIATPAGGIALLGHRVALVGKDLLHTGVPKRYGRTKK